MAVNIVCVIKQFSVVQSTNTNLHQTRQTQQKTVLQCYDHCCHKTALVIYIFPYYRVGHNNKLIIIYSPFTSTACNVADGALTTQWQQPRTNYNNN